MLNVLFYNKSLRRISDIIVSNNKEHFLLLIIIIIVVPS
jgi:hypothetical protein